jgi:hypothetical protein
VGIWIYQIAKLGHPSHLATLIWRPLAAGAAMSLVLYAVRESPIVWQIGGAFLGVVVYGLGLFALRTFSSKELHQAREGIAFVSPFVASWAKKLKGDS